MTDINTLGLSLALDLDSTAANLELDSFGAKAVELQEAVAKAATAAVGGIGGSAGDASSHLNSAVNSAKSFAKAGNTAASSLQPAVGIHETIAGFTDDEVSKIGSYADAIGLFIKQLTKKNSLHEEELGLVSDEQKVLKATTDVHKNNTSQVVDGEKALARVKQTMQAIWVLVKAVDQATENFVQTNFRAYGSMQELANEARGLQSELGVTNEVAMETIKSLAEVKTPEKDFDQLAKTIAKSNRTTGVGVKELAQYSLYLRNLGFDANDTESQIGFMTDAMRKYGLTQNDINQLMSRTGMEALNLQRLFGKTAEEMKKFEKVRVSMAAVGKEIGLSASQLEGFYSSLSTNVGAMQQFAALTNSQITDTKSFNQAMFKSGFALDRKLEALEAIRDATPSTANSDQILAQEEALAEAYFGGNLAMMRSTRQMSKMAKEMGIASNDAEGMAKVMIAVQKKAVDPFDESNQSLTAQLRILSETISGTLMPFIQMLADGLGKIVMVLNMLLSPLLYVIKLIGEFLAFLGKIPILGSVLKFIVGLGGALAILVAGLIASGIAITGFALSLGMLSTVVTGAMTIVSSFATMMVTIARSIGQSIVVLLTSIGQGLAALGKAVQGVLPQLIGLAFALLLVGAGMYLLGLGVALVAEQGWMAVAAMFAMVAAMIIAIVALAIIATIAAPVVPLIVALAFAVLLLGAAAMLAGIGFYLIGQSIQSVAEYGLQAATAIAALILPVLGLGLAGLVAAPGLFLLGMALMLIAPAAYILAISFSLMVRALETFVQVMPKLAVAGDTLLYFGATLLGAVALMLLAGLLMIPAGAAMLIGSVLLFMAGIGLFIAGASLAVGGGMLVIGAGVIALAAVILLPASLAVFVSGFMLMAGGYMMLAGAIAMLASAAILIAASGALIAASFLLYIAMAIITPAVGAAVVVGASLLFAGGAMLIGAVMMLYTAKILHVASTLMMTSAVLLDIAMQLLLPAAYLSVVVGIYLLAGALRIVVASAMLMIAGYMLVIAAVLIMYASIMLLPAAVVLTFASIMLMVAGFYLIVAGFLLTTAADLLLPAATELMLGAVVMLGASMALFYAGMLLVPAAVMLAIGMFLLIYAIAGFIALSSKILMVGIGMKLLAQGFIMLANAPLSGFKAAAKAALSAMPMLKQLVGELSTTAVELQDVADQFTKPVDQIAASLNSLGDALSNVSQGLDLANQIGELAVLLDQYSHLMESTAQRLEVAVSETAQPAINSARAEGLEDVVRAETIDTVQVKTDTTGGTEQIDTAGDLMAEQNEILRNILETLAGQEGNDLSEISGLLRDGMGSGSPSGGLANELNQWMK